MGLRYSRLKFSHTKPHFYIASTTHLISEKMVILAYFEVNFTKKTSKFLSFAHLAKLAVSGGAISRNHIWTFIYTFILVGTYFYCILKPIPAAISCIQKPVLAV